MKYKISNFIFLLFSFISLVLCPNRIVIILRKLKNKFLSARFSILIKTSENVYLHSPFYVKGHKYIHIGKNFVACPGFRIECWDKYGNVDYSPSIVIGDNVCFNYNCHIGAINQITIGDNVLVGSHVLITDHSHGTTNINQINISPAKRFLYSKGPVIIENDIWIGEGVAILPGVTIGHNSIIGANSVITKDIPPYSVVGGNPAKVLKNIL